MSQVLSEPTRRGRRAPSEAASDDLQASIGGGRSNWLWLAELSRWERALDLGVSAVPQTAGLAEHFTSVHYLRRDRSLLGGSWTELTAEGYANVAPVCGAPVELPYRDAAFDCVAVDDGCAGALAHTTGIAFRAIQNALLEECRRILRPGGCLYVGIASAKWCGRPADPADRFGTVAATSAAAQATRRRASHAPRTKTIRTFRGLARHLRRAGFSRVRAYCVEPSYEQPLCIIPLDRRAILAYESWGREGSSHDRLRRSLAWLGLSDVLYPSLIYLAYA
jgi:SAM-dependent methyltransferase